MDNYKVRFHLGAGEHYMHWQVRHSDNDDVKFYNPDKYAIHMLYIKLINIRKTAEKIFSGENKSVCAWVECEDVIIYPIEESHTIPSTFEAIHYNPKRFPHWTNMKDENIDWTVYKEASTCGRKLFAGKKL